MSLINAANLSFTYEGSHDPVFKDVSFQIDTDWKLGITGRNGRGKTTLLRLLMGRLDHGGTISSSMDFEYFPYDVPDTGRTALDAALAVSPGFELWQFKKELAALQVADEVLGRPYGTLSKGEQTKVLLAAMFLKENNYLLIDEPTNHLDLAAREIVSRYLNSKKSFILVSHDRAFLDHCIDHIMSINRQNIEIQSGNFSTWLENKRRQDSYEQARNDLLKKDIRKLTEAARRTSVWSSKTEKEKNGRLPCGTKADRGYVGHKAAKMMKVSKVIEARQETAAEEKSRLLRNVDSAENLKLAQLQFHSKRLAELEDLCVVYGAKQVCGPLSFTIDQGDRIALTGRNGSGKSSIVRLLCGEEVPHRGALRKNGQLIISYVPQDTSGLSGSLTDYARESSVDESLFKAILDKLGVTKPQFEKDMGDFSAGQKKKVLIARSLSEKAHLHIWDEPLNYIDVLSRMQIEELLLTWKPTILFVEHDRAFCENVATKTVAL